MPTPALSDDLARQAWEIFELYEKRYTLGADHLGISEGAFRNRVDKARERGFHMSDGARNAMQNAGLNGREARGGWIHNYETGDDGKKYKIGTTRWAADNSEAADEWLAKMVSAFSDVPAAPAIVQSEKSAEGKIAFFPQTDVHVGVDVTADRGGREYTPEIALERMKDGFAQTHAAIPPCETAIILDNGDLTHANDDRDVTYKNQHRLKVRGSHYSNLSLCVIGKIWQIDMALERSARVIYRSQKGNHDPSTPSAMHLALKQRYANEPRVLIDDTERQTWVYQRGLVFLAANHGDGLKPAELAVNLMPNFPDEFGVSRFWYLFTGHFHEEASRVFGGVRWFQLPSMCALDQHAADLGYSDSAAMRAMMFCERSGLKHDMTVRF